MDWMKALPDCRTIQAYFWLGALHWTNTKDTARKAHDAVPIKRDLSCSQRRTYHLHKKAWDHDAAH